VSLNEASLDLREIDPLSRNILHSCGVGDHGTTGQRTNQKLVQPTTGFRCRLHVVTGKKGSTSNLNYLVDVRDSAKSGLGYPENRHLNHLVESISVNVGGPCQDAKASSPPIPDKGVGAAIVVRGWESQPQGEGPQSVGNSSAE